jgi:lysozyme
VQPGDHKSIEACKALLISDLQIYASGIDAYMKVPLPDKRFVALVSFAFNVGVGAACGSSVVGLINQGKPRQGCDAWNRAAGVLPRGAMTA